MEPVLHKTETRRDFLRQTTILIGAAALFSPLAILSCAEKETAAEVTATEELMREHGLLRRLLLVYEEMARRVQCCQDLPPAALLETAALTRRLAQEHHEKLEEEHLFPLFERAGKHVALVKILRGQHEAGRKLLDYLQHHAGLVTARNFVHRAQLEAHLRLLTRMYRAHMAREDTILLPALRSIVSPQEFVALGKKFQEQTQARFGPDGYEKMPAEVGDLEKMLGIYDLEEFTPKI